jgi:hypothetical protein
MVSVSLSIAAAHAGAHAFHSRSRIALIVDEAAVIESRYR